MFKRCCLLFLLLFFASFLFTQGAFAEKPERIVLPASLKEIKEDSFFGAKNIREVVFPDGLESIGAGAFASSSLEKVSFPASVKYIGPGAFDGAPIQSVSAPGGSYAEIWAKKNGYMGYTPADDFTYVIEDGKCTITKFNREDREVIVPPMIDDCPVVAIGEKAFYYRRNLVSITLPDSVTRIGKDAFGNCTRLAHIDLSDSLTFIDGYAFYECNKLTSISLPDSLSTVGSLVFRSCGLTSITLPDSITTIEHDAFYECKSLTEVILPDTLVSIEYNAFAKCRSLSRISLPESLVSIGNHAFDGCSNLASIILPNSLTSIEGGAFSYCSSLTAITLPDSLSSVGGGMFVGCGNLTSVTLPNSLTSLGDSMFKNCSSLKTITLPDSLTSIGNDAFQRSGLTEITLPDSLISIGDRVFSECENLKSIVLPDSLSSIGDYPFQECSALARITLPSTLTRINSDLLAICTGLTYISIPESVTVIESNAFRGCTNLTGVSLPNSITSMGEYVFQGCSSLKSITIPDSLTSVPVGMCDKCSSLTDIFFPDTLKKIGSEAFRDCDRLTDVSLPDSLTEIFARAFESCDSLISIDFPQRCTSIGSYAFSDCSSLTDVTFADSSSTKWIYSYAFQNCTSMRTVKLPDKLQSIDTGVFKSCVSLESLYIPRSVTGISQSAFSGCARLTLSYEPNSYAEKWAKENLRVSNPFCMGYSYTCYPNIAFFNGERPEEYTLESSDPSIVAIVDDVSTEAPLGPMMRLMTPGGRATVTAHVGDITTSFTVMDGLSLSVSDGRALAVSDTGYSFSMLDDEKLQLIPELNEQVIPCADTGLSFLVPLEDRQILTCDQDGMIHVKKPGTATIYVQTIVQNGPAELSVRCDVTITENPVRYRALLFGINDYTEYDAYMNANVREKPKTTEITNVAKNDCLIMQGVLQNVDQKYNVQTFLDISKAGVDTQLDQLAAVADYDDVSFIYFICHGDDDKSLEGSNFAGRLVFGSVDKPLNEALYTDFHYNLNALKNKLDNIHGKKYLVLGSCGSGALLELVDEDGDQLFHDIQYTVITASSAYEKATSTSYPFDSNQNLSFFERAFGEAVEFSGEMPADANKDQKLSIKELKDYIKRNFPMWFINQDPVFWSLNPEDDIIFTRKGTH